MRNLLDTTLTVQNTSVYYYYSNRNLFSRKKNKKSTRRHTFKKKRRRRLKKIILTKNFKNADAISDLRCVKKIDPTVTEKEGAIRRNEDDNEV